MMRMKVNVVLRISPTPYDEDMIALEVLQRRKATRMGISSCKTENILVLYLASFHQKQDQVA
jgi:hypothetical protein